MAFPFEVNGAPVEVDDDSGSLLEVLRERLGLVSVKDGCSPQGQCGCCTVLVDGAPRVACVTPARRVAGRRVTTLEGLPDQTRRRLLDAFVAAGASQCGFCTPGIIVRLAALGEGPTPEQVTSALLAHLCRCTGWQTIVEAATAAVPGQPAGSRLPHHGGPRDLDATVARATLEGGSTQRVGADVAGGHAGFADDTAPADALVAVPTAAGEWAVGPSLAAARASAGKVQGRRSGTPPAHPVDVPPGEWAVTLRTSWVEPAYVEPDASWCRPGGEPVSPLANGGAFGGKLHSVAPAAARRLADEHRQPVRVVLSREDVVRLGPKRPPIAAGVRPDGTGVIRVVRTPGVADAIRSVAPGLVVEEVDVAGPATSAAVRGAGWAEAAILAAAAAAVGAGAVRRALDGDAGAGWEAIARISAPGGATAVATVTVDGPGAPRSVRLELSCGDALDEVVLRSYAIGASHMALGWVCTEGIGVDDTGVPLDLTIRSFGILRARDMPPIEVRSDGAGTPVRGSDAAFAAVAAACWMAQGLPPAWPTLRGKLS